MKKACFNFLILASFINYAQANYEATIDDNFKKHFIVA
jgi:hypothetical protein